MNTEFDSFVKTLQIGERILNLTFKTLEDAYAFSKKYYSEDTRFLIDFFVNHGINRTGEYEYNLIRYYYIKAIEHRISSDLFADTSRGNVCDVFRSPFDIDLKNYPTNLPYHLEMLVNSKQPEACKLTEAIIDELNNDQSYHFGETILNAVMFLGQVVGYQLSQSNMTYMGYDCSTMLTRNEINSLAGTSFCKWLNNNGHEIIETNFSRDTYQNIVAAKDNNLLFIIIAAEITPIAPSFIPLDLDNLFNIAHDNNAIPYYASISLGSENEKHFKDGVIIYGDKVRYKVNAFYVLEQEKS